MPCFASFPPHFFAPFPRPTFNPPFEATTAATTMATFFLVHRSRRKCLCVCRCVCACVCAQPGTDQQAQDTATPRGFLSFGNHLGADSQARNGTPARWPCAHAAGLPVERKAWGFPSCLSLRPSENGTRAHGKTRFLRKSKSSETDFPRPTAMVGFFSEW